MDMYLQAPEQHKQILKGFVNQNKLGVLLSTLKVASYLQCNKGLLYPILFLLTVVFHCTLDL